jgi:hypothetical protein
VGDPRYGRKPPSTIRGGVSVDRIGRWLILVGAVVGSIVGYIVSGPGWDVAGLFLGALLGLLLGAVVERLAKPREQKSAGKD